jgi:hypothetical protein
MKVRRAKPTGVCAALFAALVALALSPPAEGRDITGTLSAPGYRVLALAPSGRVALGPPRRRFRVQAPARRVTLHLVDRKGGYFGPVIVGRRGLRLLTGVRSGADLGRVHVFRARGFARTERRLRGRDRASVPGALARDGAPAGAGTYGRTRSRAGGPGRPGTDTDHDGIPGLYDVDDDGDLIPDAGERRPAAALTPTSAAAPAGLASACPQLVCSGRTAAKVTDVDDDDLALALAALAALLAAISLGWQIAAALARRRRRVNVETRLGLPVYQQGGGSWAVFIEVRNGTAYPVRWVAATLTTSDGRSLYLMQFPPGGELPAVIEPGDSHHTWVSATELERSGLDLRTPIAAEVKLADGTQIGSRARRLVSRSFADRLRGQR